MFTKLIQEQVRSLIERRYNITDAGDRVIIR